jgi:uncharacterized protein
MPMNFCFDPAKDAANIAKHGVSLAIAEQLEWDSALVWPEGRRIISLRKANSREVNRYVGQD